VPHLRLRVSKTVLVSLFSIVVATAQTDTGSIGGFVKDPSGGVIPKAQVTLKDEGTNEVHALITDGAGYYIAPNLPPGMYTMTAEAPGFKRFESAHNRLAPNTALSLDASLAVGEATETVEVTATAAVLQTDSAAVQAEVTGAVVNMQELNGRDPLFEAGLLPGMRGSASMGDFNYPEGVTEPFNVNGTRQQDTLVTIDGGAISAP
jgi:Carboxypeptidase regulatory-like domain